MLYIICCILYITYDILYILYTHTHTHTHTQVSLKGKMSLGVVQKDEKAVTSRFKVSKFPQILVVKPGQKKPIKYDGKLTDIREIFEFLNKYQETFAMENRCGGAWSFGGSGVCGGAHGVSGVGILGQALSDYTVALGLETASRQ